MNSRILLVSGLLLLVLSPVGYAEDYDDYVVDVYINNNDCPIQIVDWNAWYRTNDTITFGDALLSAYSDTAPTVREAGFQYDLRIKHNGTTDIVAWQVNVVVFSAFDEYLDTFGIFQGAVLEPGKDITRNNLAMFNGDNTFLTFFIWVDKIRDADGNLYFADLEAVKAMIDERMEIDFPEDLLQAGYVQEINQSLRFREEQYVNVYDGRDE
jgi:hypothetical protein